MNRSQNVLAVVAHGQNTETEAPPKPLTGDPEKDGFTSTPSVFMIESMKGLKPGKALDVGAGQGRNAVWKGDWGCPPAEFVRMIARKN